MKSNRLPYTLGLIAVIVLFAIWNQSFNNKKKIHSAIPNQEQSHHHEKHQHSHEEENVVKLSKKQLEEINFQINVAEPGALVSTLAAHGKIILHPNRLARIIPKVSGIAQEAYKNTGDNVKTGEILAILETAEVADTKAAFLSALSKERLAASVLNREKKLYDEKVSSAQDFMTAKNLYEESVINVQLAKQKLKAFGFTEAEIKSLTDQNEPDLRLYPIRAPIDGTVIARNMTKGEYIENNKTIYEIADLGKVLVEIGIYPKDLYQIKEGQSVEVLAPTENNVAQAKLVFVSPIVAAETITAKAVAELDNSQKTWRPGTFVKVNIDTGKKEAAVVIPKQAVQTSAGKDFVFIVTSEGFERRFVHLGQSDQHHVEVVSGLRPGEEYVANKTFMLKAELGKSSAEHMH